MADDSAEFVKLVLGGLALFPATGEAEDVAKAAWALDKTTKNFLLACWRRRAHFVGHLRVCGGALVREDATDAREAASVPAETPRRSAAQLEACKPFWVDWIRKPAKPRSGKRSKGRSPFFVVLAGSRPGVLDGMQAKRVGLPRCQVSWLRHALGSEAGVGGAGRLMCVLPVERHLTLCPSPFNGLLIYL